MDTKINVKNNILWSSAGSFIYMLTQWLLSVFIVRISGFDDAGTYSLAMSIANVFYGIAIYGMRNYQVSDISGKYENRQYIDSRFVTCLVAIIGCLIFTVINRYDLKTIIVICLYMIFKAHEALVDVFHGIDQKKWSMDIIGKSFIIRGLLNCTAFVVSLYIWKKLEVSILLMVVISYLVIGLYDVPKAGKIDEIWTGRNKKKVEELLKECFPLVVYVFMSTAITSIPRYILELYYGSSILGIYSSVSMPATVVQVMATYVFSPIMSLFALELSSRSKNRFSKLLFKCLGAITIIALLSLGGAKVLGKWALCLIFGKEIEPYAYMLIPVIICSILTALVWFSCSILTVLRDFKGLLISNACSLIGCIVLSIYYIKKYSMDGVNIVLILTLALQILLCAGFIGNKIKKL